MTTCDYHSLHGHCIRHDQLDQVITRNDLRDEHLVDLVDGLINNNQDLYFMPTSTHETQLSDGPYKKHTYKLLLFGSLIDGRKITVMLTGIDVYFDVKLDSVEDNADDIMDILRDEIDSYGRPAYDPINYELIQRKPIMLYQNKPSTYMRIYFNKLHQRKGAITYLQNKKYKTATDDMSCYYRVVCRNYLITLSSWAVLKRYNPQKIDNIKGLTYVVDIRDYIKYNGDIISDELLAKDKTMEMCWDIETHNPDGDIPLPHRTTDAMYMISMTFGWYYSDNQLLKICLVEMPCAVHPDYLTIICDNEQGLIRAFATIFEHMTPDIVTGYNDSTYDWNWLIRRAATYPQLLSTIATQMAMITPINQYKDIDIVNPNTGFSSGTEGYVKLSIKIDADTDTTSKTLILPGYINIDVMTIFRQLIPNAECNEMRWFLQNDNHSSKEDMPYSELFAIYRSCLCARRQFAKLLKADDTLSIYDLKKIAATRRTSIAPDVWNRIKNIHTDIKNMKNDMARAASYCVVDSIRCHDLLNGRTVIKDRREVADISYTSLFDAINRANGMKVLNLIIAVAQQHGFLCSQNRNSNNNAGGKYPGAYVFPPDKGLHISKLSINERIEKYKMNQSDTKFIHDMPILKQWNELKQDELDYCYSIIDKYGPYAATDQQLDQIEKDGGKRMPACMRSFMKERLGRPISGLDFASLYPMIIMTYNFSPEMCIIDENNAIEARDDGHDMFITKFLYNGKMQRIWTIKHNGKTDQNDPDCKLGIYGLILKDLFDRRAIIKKEMKRYGDELETLAANSAGQLPQSSEERRRELLFRYNYYDSKQKALKVFMNTFYGTAGSRNSPSFLVQLAGGVTTRGKYNIKMVQHIVEQLGCCVHYGDTDSCYISIPGLHFDELDKQYYTNCIDKLAYWSGLVQTTFTHIKGIRDIVNEKLIEDNGSRFLRMAYEEVLFPVTFLAKKKYYGAPHEDQIVFPVKKMFIKGLEVKKRGVSTILRKVFTQIMRDSLDHTNYRTLLELVESHSHNIYNTKWDYDDFMISGIYKPNRKNVKMLTFARRMQEENIPITPFQRFNYVIVKKYPYVYDDRGRTRALQVGDKIEFYERAKQLNMPIDFDYYVSRSIIGQFARLIVYLNEFTQKALNGRSYSSLIEDQIIDLDKNIYTLAVQYMTKFTDPYITKYNSKGSIYQAIYRKSNATINHKLVQMNCDTNIASLLKAQWDTEQIDEWLCKQADKVVTRKIKTSKYGEKYVKTRLNDIITDNKQQAIYKLQHVYYGNDKQSILSLNEKSFKQRLAFLRSKILSKYTVLIKLHNMHTQMINYINNNIRSHIDIDNKYNEPNSLVPNHSSVLGVNEDVLVNTLSQDVVNEFMNNTDIQDALCDLTIIYSHLLSTYNMYYRITSIVDYLRQMHKNTPCRQIACIDNNKQKAIAIQMASEAAKLSTISIS